MSEVFFACMFLFILDSVCFQFKLLCIQGEMLRCVIDNFYLKFCVNENLHYLILRVRVKCNNLLWHCLPF